MTSLAQNIHRAARQPSFRPTAERSDIVATTLARVMTKQAFFASYFYANMKLVETLDTPTAATDGDTIWINPEFFETMTLDECVFVFCHEVLHAVFMHMPRGKFWRESGLGPDGKRYLPRLANMAADYIINAILKVSHVGSMPRTALWRRDIDGDWALEDAYKKLASEQPEQPEQPEQEGEGEGEGGGDGGHGGFDHHEEPGGAPKEEAAVAIAAQAALQAAKIVGDVPAALERAVAKLLEPKVEWEEELRRALEPTVGRDDKSWRRPNRRQLALHDIFLPSSCGFQVGGVVVQIDTSGSVSEGEMGQFLSELSHIMGHCRPEWLKILWVDAECYEEDLDDPADLEFVKPKGGGGTNMGKGLDYVRNMPVKPETLVVLTDGYTPWGSPIEDVDILWGITNKHIKADHGKTIHVEVD